MLEMVVFDLVAFALFVIIFFKIIKRNDANYIILLIIQAIGITIGFIHTYNHNSQSFSFVILRYICSIVIPFIICLFEIKGHNFSEIISILEATFFLTIGNNKKAKKILAKLVSKYQNSYYGHKMLAECYEREGGMRRAIEEYVTAVDLRKNDSKSFFKIAEILRDLGKNDEAIEMLNRLLKVKPDCYEASILLGDIYCEEEKFKEAANVYNEALKYRPFDFDLYFNLGIVYTRLSDFQLAKEMYEKAAEINHRNYALNYNLALISFMQGDLENAERYFEQSLYEEMEASSYYQLAKIYVYKNENDKAITFLNKAIELEPTFLKVAVQDKVFKNIRQYITVSVNMDNNQIEEKNEEEIEIESINKNGKLKFDLQVKLAREYLEETSQIIEEMREGLEKEELNEKLNYLFNKPKEEEKVKEEKVKDNLTEQNKNFEEKQRNNL